METYRCSNAKFHVRKVAFKMSFFICAFLIGLGLFLAPVYNVSAQTNFNFGGLVTASIFCTCSYNFLVYIAPNGTKPNGFFSYRFTPQFANYRLPTPGEWALGLYSPGDTCLMWVPAIPPFCTIFIQPMGIITPIVGTSL